MRRLRESWLAFGGSALIIALSVSSALGADPALDAIDNVGQQVSEFARGLAPGQNETADEPDAEEQPDLEEDEQLDEADEVDVDTDEDTLGDDEDADAQLAPGDEGFDWTGVSHGVCVSWHAHEDRTDHEDENDDQAWNNHGEFVSYASHVLCRDDGDGDEADEEADEADTEANDEDADAQLAPGDEGFDWTGVSHGVCVSWHAHEDRTDHEDENDDQAWNNHGEFVSYASHVLCRDDGDGDEAAEEADEADTEANDEDADAKADAKAAREAERADAKAERAAARAERKRNK